MRQPITVLLTTGPMFRDWDALSLVYDAPIHFCCFENELSVGITQLMSVLLRSPVFMDAACDRLINTRACDRSINKKFIVITSSILHPNKEKTG